MAHRIFVSLVALVSFACGAQEEVLDDPLADEATLIYHSEISRLEPFRGNVLDLNAGKVFLLNKEATSWNGYRHVVEFAHGYREDLARWLAAQNRKAGLDIAASDSGRIVVVSRPFHQKAIPSLLPGLFDLENCRYRCFLGSFSGSICVVLCGDSEFPNEVVEQSFDPQFWWFFSPEPWGGDGHTDPPPWDPEFDSGGPDDGFGGSPGGSSGGSSGGGSSGGSDSGSSDSSPPPAGGAPPPSCPDPGW